MKIRYLDYLACPFCAEGLAFHGLPAGEPDADIGEGELRCPSCRQIYPVRSGIPRFPAVTSNVASDAVRRTRHTYDFTWARFGAAAPLLGEGPSPHAARSVPSARPAGHGRRSSAVMVPF